VFNNIVTFIVVFMTNRILLKTCLVHYSIIVLLLLLILLYIIYYILLVYEKNL